MTSDIKIRVLSEEDIPQILQICRESFPNSFKWQAHMKFGTKWWKTIKASKAAKTYVLTKNTEICGFCLLVTDIVSFNRHKADLKPQRREMAMLLLKNPKLLLKQIINKMRNILLLRKVKRGVETSTKVNPATTTWVELVAISGKYRRQGFSKLIYDYMEHVSLELGKNNIGAAVQAYNVASTCMHKRFGYELHSCSQKGAVFIKQLR